jgi:hypothetical protein
MIFVFGSCKPNTSILIWIEREVDINAEVELPAAEASGVTAAQQAAVERNMNAAAFLMSAIPDSLVINVMAARIASGDWPYAISWWRT